MWVEKGSLRREPIFSTDATWIAELLQHLVYLRTRTHTLTSLIRSPLHICWWNIWQQHWGKISPLVEEYFWSSTLHPEWVGYLITGGTQQDLITHSVHPQDCDLIPASTFPVHVEARRGISSIILQESGNNSQPSIWIWISPMFCFTTRHNTQNIFSTPSYLKMFLIPPLMKNEIGLWNEIYSVYVLKISEFNRFQPFELKLPVNNIGWVVTSKLITLINQVISQGFIPIIRQVSISEHI